MSFIDPKQIGHLRVAFCTKNLTHVDVAFTFARQVVIYDVSYDDATFLDVARFSAPRSLTVSERQEIRKQKRAFGKNGGCCMMDDMGGTELEQLPQRVEAVTGCSILFSYGLSDLAAIRLRDVGIFPVKIDQIHEIDETLRSLQHTMNHNPPLWIRRALGYGIQDGLYRVAVSS
ncbi:nitrogen fixation protein [Celerinatantimonas sp. YJH-8]|uniref:nitrogen fixation protein n=1 Tax=Celerinatantimonas sp. YJH-8 TaxID=3228714 RepID=UPI0038C547BC